MIDTDFSVWFQIHICDHMPQNGKSDCFADVLQGELLLVYCNSHRKVECRTFQFLDHHIKEEMCLFLRKYTAFGLKLNAPKHFIALRLFINILGLIHILLIRISTIAKCQLALVL